MHPGARGQFITDLMADYWWGVPDSEEVVLANFSTPLAHIPEIAVSFFDATVLVSSFAHA